MKNRIVAILILLIGLPVGSAGQNETISPEESPLQTLSSLIPKQPDYLRKADWAKTLAEEITKAIPHAPLPSFYLSLDNKLLCIVPAESDTVLLVHPAENELLCAAAAIDEQAAATSLDIWKTAPKARAGKIADSGAFPMTPQHFPHLIVVEAKPSSPGKQGASVCANLHDQTQKLLIYHRPFFEEQAIQLNRQSERLLLSESEALEFKPDTLIAVHFATLLYRFSYHLTLENLDNAEAPSPPGTDKIFALFKILDLVCYSKRYGSVPSLFGVHTDQSLITVLETIRLEATNERKDFAAAYVFWTLFQKKLIRYSLLTHTLEYDKDSLQEKIPALLERMENRLLQESAFSIPPDFSAPDFTAFLVSLRS